VAIRFDAATDQLSRTTSLPSITNFTLMAWIWFPANIPLDTAQCALNFGPTTPGDAQQYLGVLGQAGPTNKLILYTTGQPTLVGTMSLSVNTWYHVAMAIAGTGASQVRGYLNGVQEMVGPGSGTPVGQKLLVAQSAPGGESFNGRVAALKIYSAVLTASEMQQELRAYVPVRTLNLNSWYPLLTQTDVANYGPAWTVGGTLTTEDGPPIPWSLLPHMMQHAA
jgi:hypothetical protein